MNNSDDDDDDPPGDGPGYEVGYGRPPVAHRFVRGAPSPNPSGRPRGSRDRKVVTRQIANELRSYSEGQKRRRTTNLKLVLLTVRNRVAQGDLLAFSILDWLTGVAAVEEPGVPKGVLIVGEKLTTDEWLAKYGHLGARAT